ncbi:methyltransferase domain-containing protein [uncultured Helicobacter sp.]|uniref:class I SAM-dependent methyltransferase n=1 Tax=uncultured Helicobacter sp. TaxID=175537 RepID=UPI00374E4A12
MTNESIFDKLLRTMRLMRVLPSIREFENPRLLDIGCGFEARLLREVEGYIAKGVGIDYKAPEIHTDKLHTFSYVFESKHELGLEASSANWGGADTDYLTRHSPNQCSITLPFENESFEIVTMLAVIEHLSAPIAMLREIERVLVPNGILLLTAPSHAAKPVLEFLSYRLHLIDEREIRDHKRYYNKRDFIESLAQVPHLKLLKHRYFQCGMNNFLKAQKVLQ